MNETGRNKPNTVNSFVIRIWQEFPGQWRGTIRHVQSEAQKAFTTLNQAVQFIDQQTKPVGAASEKKEDAQGLNSLLRLRRPQMLAGAVLAILLIVTVGLGAVVNAPLLGTAVGGGGAGFDVVMGFVAGVLVGGLVVGMWMRWRRG